MGVGVGVQQPGEGNYYQNGAIHFERRLLADSGARGAADAAAVAAVAASAFLFIVAAVTYATRKYFHCFACARAASRALARFCCY